MFILAALWQALCRAVLSHSVLPDSLSPPGSSVHRILQVRILDWVALQADSLLTELPGKPSTESSEAKRVLVTLLLHFYAFFVFLVARHVGSQLPDPGIRPTLPALEGEVVTTGLPGKSLLFVFEEWLIV